VVYAENCFTALYNPSNGLFSFPYFVDKFDSPPPPVAMARSCTAYVFRTGKPLLLSSSFFYLLVEKGEVELVGSPSPSWIGIPLVVNNKPMGVMVLQHYEKENVYTDDNIRFLLSVSSQIAMVIARTKAEEEIRIKNDLLQTINAEKDKFFSIVAHDLRGPLSSFVTATEILIDEIQTMSLEDIKDLTIAMKNDASNVYKLLENLLEWSRLKRGVLEFTPEQLNLQEAVSQSIKPVQEMAAKKNISIIIDSADDEMVLADRHMLETIIRNLVSNAIKFSFPGGRIEISTRVSPGQPVKISVADNCIGMSSDMKNKLFLLNEKTNRRGTHGEPSSGLGLILIKEFVDKHNGEITVESQEGAGSTFIFTLNL